MRKSLFLSFAALASTAFLFMTFAPQAESQVITPGPSVCNSIPRELLLSYDTTGGTLTGPINVNLQVYSNGEVKYSRSSGLSTPTSSVQHVFVTPNVAMKLLKRLRGAGAFSLCDQNLIVADVPLSTLTVLMPKQDGRFHTFSYSIGFGPGYAEVSQLINDFIGSNIPVQ